MRIPIRSLLFFLISSYFVIYALEGCLRYAFLQVSLGFLIYCKDVFLILSTIIVLKLSIRNWRIKHFQLGFLLLLFFLTLSSFLNSISMVQILFGLKVLLPMLFGFFFIQYFISDVSKYFHLFRVLTLITLLGIVLNIFFDFPWQGLVSEIGGVELETSRTAYMAGGFKRLSGFSRTWSNAAYVLLIGLVFEIVFADRNRLIKILNVTLILLGILVTTNKGAFAAAIIILSLKCFHLFISKKVIKIAPLILSVVVVATPLIIWSGALENQRRTGLFRVVFNSLFVRFENEWPGALKLVIDHANIFTGRGISGIAAGQVYFERSLYNPADNLFIYLFAISGSVFAIVFILILVVKGFSLNLEFRLSFFFYYQLIALLSIGLIGTALENPILGFFFGLLFGFLFMKKSRETSRLWDFEFLEFNSKDKTVS